MVKRKNETKIMETEETPVLEAQTLALEKEKRGLKKSTIAVGALLLGVAVVWGIVGYQAQSGGNSIFGSYFKKGPQDVVVATIDGEEIYLSQIEKIAQQVPQLAELPFDMIYPQLLQRYVNEEVLLKSAQDAEVQKDPKVREEIKNMRNTLLKRAYMEKRIDELATPEKLKELYLEELKTIKRQDEVHARHILVRTEKEANDIIIQLKAGADFTMLANAKSLDAADGNGGDLGYFQQNMMIPEFGEAVFALKKGQISQPIKTPFGWHVVLVEDRRLASPPAFEEVQDQLRQLFVELNLQNILKQENEKHNVQLLVPFLSQPANTASEMEGSEPVELTVQETAQAAEDKALKPADGVTETAVEGSAEGKNAEVAAEAEKPTPEAVEQK